LNIKMNYILLSILQITPETYTLSLHDALPICLEQASVHVRDLFRHGADRKPLSHTLLTGQTKLLGEIVVIHQVNARLGELLFPRSEEHTSELQSRFDLVCRLLLEKKKTPYMPL